MDLKNVPLREFVIEEFNNISELKRQLIKDTHEQFGGRAMMLTPADQAEHMAFLAKLAGAKKGIELGVFTGYTSLCFAEVLPADGILIAIDVNYEYTTMAMKYFKAAGVSKKIKLRLEGGIHVLDELLADPSQVGTFDFAYVDADKANYPNYLDRLALLLRPGGFIMFDNVLWSGTTAIKKCREKDEDTMALY